MTVTPDDLERGAREESYAQRLREWREDKITDEAWEMMLQTDPDFRAWLWKMGW